MLADSFGRIATDLRVSVTDRCNLRCSYCMPAEGRDWLPSPALLTDGEMTRLIAIARITVKPRTARRSRPHERADQHGRYRVALGGLPDRRQRPRAGMPRLV